MRSVRTRKHDGKLAAMRSLVFHSMLLVSIFVLIVLAGGYLGRIGVVLARNSSVAPGPFYRETTVSLEDGRVKCWVETWKTPPTAGIPAGVRIHPVVELLRFRVPDLRRAVWEFDAHSLPPVRGSQARIFACPIWCVALPWLIAPIAWLRHRVKNQKREPRGFGVLATGSVQPGDDRIGEFGGAGRAAQVSGQ